MLRIFSFALLLPAFPLLAQESRFAIWNPGKPEGSSRLKVDLELPEKTAAALQTAKLPCSLLTTDELADPAQFNAKRFDALFFQGDFYPEQALKNLGQFADDGGVVIALESTIPFLIQAAPNAGGFWEPIPAQPAFAWQKRHVMDAFGIDYSYIPALSSLGITHTPSALLLRYLPDAGPVNAKLPSQWVIPAAGSQFYALMRSSRVDYQDTTPAMYLARRGPRSMIVSTSGVFTQNDDPKLWNLSNQTIAAFARLATDLRNGKATLSPDLLVRLEKKMEAPEPLRTRKPAGKVEPENAIALQRWGQFDGASFELETPLPASLAAGAAVTLPLSDSVRSTAAPLFLRIRGAYAKTGAGLRIGLGERTLLNERFTYITALPTAGRYQNVPAEFTRILFVPPGWDLANLTLENPGSSPVYFDAIQMEKRTQPSPDMLVSLGIGYDPEKLPPALVHEWGGPPRMSVRINELGPPDAPNRWKAIHAKIDQALGLSGSLHLIAEGTAPWMAITPERLAEAERARRAHTCVPDTAKFAEAIGELATKYRGKIPFWEIWNEPDIQQFWRGTVEEYIGFLKTIAPILKKADPGTRTVVAGMAGYDAEYLDRLIAADFANVVDLFAFHPYCSKTPAWDVPLGLVEGHLMSKGVNIEIYSDESGFVFRNSGWFMPPPQYTPEVQRDLLDVAMARSLSNGLAKLSVFHAGGRNHEFGLIEDNGTPRPAYAVFADYAKLSRNGSRRLDLSLTHAEGEPLAGVYAVASRHADGSSTVVVNPVENPALKNAQPFADAFDSKGAWIVFAGAAEAADGAVTVTAEAGKPQAGFYTKGWLDLARTPILEISVPQASDTWDLLLKTGDGKSFPVITKAAAGNQRVDLRPALKDFTTEEVEFSFRIRGTAKLDSIRLAPEGADVAAQPLPVTLRIPLPSNSKYEAVLTSGDAAGPVRITTHGDAGNAWGELTFDLRGRSVLEIKKGM